MSKASIEVRFGKNKILAFRNGIGEYVFPADNVMKFLVMEGDLSIVVSKIEEGIKNGWMSNEDYLAFRAKMGYRLESFLELAKTLNVAVEHDDPEGDRYEAQGPHFRCA